MNATKWAKVSARLVAAGARFKPVSPAHRAKLEAAGAPAEWLDLLRHCGTLQGVECPMLTPAQALTARKAQRTFFRGASFGDEPEDLANLRREQAFRATLFPFQRISLHAADFFCFATENVARGRPLILSVFHDDFNLVTGADALSNPRRKTVFTRSLVEHLEWVARRLETSRSNYPP